MCRWVIRNNTGRFFGSSPRASLCTPTWQPEPAGERWVRRTLGRVGGGSVSTHRATETGSAAPTKGSVLPAASRLSPHVSKNPSAWSPPQQMAL